MIMKDNIQFKCIGNRKFVIELRFDHKAILSDKDTKHPLLKDFD